MWAGAWGGVYSGPFEGAPGEAIIGNYGFQRKRVILTVERSSPSFGSKAERGVGGGGVGGRTSPRAKVLKMCTLSSSQLWVGQGVYWHFKGRREVKSTWGGWGGGNVHGKDVRPDRQGKEITWCGPSETSRAFACRVVKWTGLLALQRAGWVLPLGPAKHPAVEQDKTE